mgnify:CR=1 FL=1
MAAKVEGLGVLPQPGDRQDATGRDMTRRGGGVDRGEGDAADVGSVVGKDSIEMTDIQAQRLRDHARSGRPEGGRAGNLCRVRAFGLNDLAYPWFAQ